MTSSRRVLIATRSDGKLKEIRALLVEAGFEPVDLRAAQIPETEEEERLETAATFEENALAKARHFHARLAMPTIADDSGLEVLALNGAPGVRSKRWSERPDLVGEALDAANNALLLRRMEGVRERKARYVCAAAYRDDAMELVERGEVEGLITTDARGRAGFGYDPYFDSRELGKTFGEASPVEKSSVSHRARAFAKLLRRLAMARSLTFG